MELGRKSIAVLLKGLETQYSWCYGKFQTIRIKYDIVLGIKTNSGRFCWHNARVRVPTRSPIPRPLGRIVRASPIAL